MHERLVRQHLVTSLALRDGGDDARQIIPIQMGALGEPVAHPSRVVAGFFLAHVSRGVPPVIHSVDDVAFDEVGVTKPGVIAMKAEEVFGRVVVAVVDFVEEL